jgi:hypothetical protein
MEASSAAAHAEQSAVEGAGALGLQVLVEQVSLHNAWGQEHMRASFPSWEELRRFDPSG